MTLIVVIFVKSVNPGGNITKTELMADQIALGISIISACFTPNSMEQTIIMILIWKTELPFWKWVITSCNVNPTSWYYLKTVRTRTHC